MTQVTIGDVLRAAEIGRAPLAAESAGYLALAVADQLVRAPLTFDPAGVLLSNEGTVSVAAGKRGDGVDAERLVRTLLGRLLSVAPSSTPALGAAARRRAGQGVGALGDELEGALIPVNRGAARRAIARLARETSRADEAGLLAAVDLDAFPSEPPPRRAPSPSSTTRARAASAPRQIEPPPPEPAPVLHVDTMLPRVASYEVDTLEPADVEPTAPPAVELAPAIEHDGDDATFAEPVEQSTHPLPVEVDRHTAPLPFGGPMPELAQRSGPLGIIAPAPAFAEIEVQVFEGTPLGIAPLAPNAAPVPPAHVVAAVPEPDAEIAPVAACAPESTEAEPPALAHADTAQISTSDVAVSGPATVRAAPATSLRLWTRPAATVDELLARFAPSDSLPHDELRGMLKRTAGLEPTPPPPGATLRADDRDAEPLDPEAPTMTAPEDSTRPARAPMARPGPRAGTGLLATLLLVGVAATIFVYARYPAFFAGH